MGEGGGRFVLFSKVQAQLFPDVSTKVSYPLPRVPPALLIQAFNPPCSLHGLWVVWVWVLVLPPLSSTRLKGGIQRLRQNVPPRPHPRPLGPPRLAEWALVFLKALQFGSWPRD